MSTDRELLELAAKAAGYAYWDFLAWDHYRIMNVYADDDTHYSWNPLDEDGDAFRLSIDLNIKVWPQETCQSAKQDGFEWADESGDGRYESMRRAITRAAAEIGRAMP